MDNLKIYEFYNIIKDSNEFNEEYYLNNYPEVKKNGDDPIYHFLTKGVKKLYNPSPSFNTDFYLHYYRDVLNMVKQVGFDNFNPLVHYITDGKKEKRKTQYFNQDFDITIKDFLDDEKLIVNRLFSYEDTFDRYENVLNNYENVLNDHKNLLTSYENQLNLQQKQLNSLLDLVNVLYSNFDIKAKGILRLGQTLALELLNLIDLFCKRNDIEYWIDSGTLLGAVRHGGFIPWDDDLDICMMRKDFDNFIKTFMNDVSRNEYLKEKIFIQYYPFDENWRKYGSYLIFAQIIFKEPLTHVDIFIHDYIGETKDFREEYTRIKKQFFNDIVNGKCDIDEGVRKYNPVLGVTEEKARTIINAIDSYQCFRMYDYEDIFPLSSITFEDYIIPCPNNTHNYLSECYGNDYMQIPKIIYNHNREDFYINQQFKSKESAEYALKSAIIQLHENIQKLYK